jgi:serine/threonine protein kinase/tetratricopeptide (TPR) repeat protein
MPPPRELTDDYRLEKILSSSRSGSILRASRIDTGRTVIIKLINVPAPADPSLGAKVAGRFSAYATALAGLRHPNLPAVLDSGLTADGGAFLVMERLDGVDFEAGAPALAAAEGNGASPDRVLPLLAQALAGLEELARHGLAHLNLCPENLFLVPAAPAAAADLDAAAPQTVKLLGLGTPLFHLGEPWPEAPCARFRAPELASPAAARQGDLPGWQADCFSLALTACYALGATVASGEVAGTLLQTVQMPLALRFELANDEALRQILERCLRQSPAERPPHAAIREAFGLALGGVEPASAAATLDLHGAGGEPSSLGPGGPGDAGNPGNWRSLLSESELPPQRPRWRTPSAADVESEPGAAAGHAGSAAAGAAPAPAGGAGGDSLLDLFDVPAALPSLPEEEDSLGLGLAGAAFGLHLPDGFELPPAPGGIASDPYGAGLLGPEPDLARPLVEAQSRPPEAAAQPPSAAQPSLAAQPFTGAQPSLVVQHTPAVQPFTAPQAPAAAQPSSMIAQAPHAAPAIYRTEVQPPGGAAALASDAPQGDMLSAVDELLGSLPPPPPVAAPPPAVRATLRTDRGGGGGRGARGGAAAVAGSAGGPSPVAPASGRKLLAPLLALPRPALLAGAGALLLAAGVTAWVLVGHGSRQAPPAAAASTASAENGSAAPAGSPPTPGRSGAAKLFDASSYLIFGKESDARVRRALRELTYADQAELGPEGCKQLAAIQQMLATSALATVQQDLAGALRNGDLGGLEDVVEVASDRDLPPSQHGDFERAKSLARLYQRAQAAAAAGDHAQVLEHFRAMQGPSKTLRDPLELRDKAAQALEADALALARDGKYDEALARLGPLLRSWPERAGVKDLEKSYQTAAASEAQQLAILEGVAGYESRRKPSVPLDQLRALQPTPHLAQRIAETQQRLEAELAQLDAQPPQVVLRPGYPLDYTRGTSIVLSFRVTDDYEVKSVKLFARPEAGKVRELMLQKSAFGYDVEIPPTIHQNGTLEIYVVATDISGHEGYLGTKDNPLRVKRRQGFQQLLH